MQQKIIISTGNVITVNDLRKAGKKPTEEVSVHTKCEEKQHLFSGIFPKNINHLMINDLH